MARIVFSHPYLNLTQPSVDKGTGAATSQPEFKPGMEVKADSGTYRYLQATSATSEGYGVVWNRSGVATSIYNATNMTTALSAALPSDIGVCVTSGGLAAKQWGWFWVGDGEDYCYMNAVCGGGYAGGNVCTFTTAGHFAATSALTQFSGDTIADLIVIDSNTSNGLRLCRSTRLLQTNFTGTAVSLTSNPN